MSTIFIKSLKLTTLVFMPLFLISNGNIESTSYDVELKEGVYILRASGNLNQELRGTVRFNTGTQTSVDGEVFSTLDLKLDNSWGNMVHSMGFLVSERNKTNKITKGTYKVASHIDGFLNDFEGVFGFANIERLGELPFFADKGSIVIENIENQTIEGFMEITLQNARGQRFKVKGTFRAIKQLK